MTTRDISRALSRPISRPLLRVPIDTGDIPLSDVIPSTTFDLDATLLSSYDGSSQTWSNIITAPSGSGAQTDYNVTLGASTTPSTDDPTFNGTAGTADARFTYDVDDFMRGTVDAPAVVKDLVTDGSKFWIGIIGKMPDPLVNNDNIYVNGDVSATTDRFTIQTRSDGVLRVRQEEGGGTITTHEFAGVLTAGATFAFIITGDQVADIMKLYDMSTTPVVSGVAWDSGLDASVGRQSVGARNDNSAGMTSGFEMKAISGGNDILDNTAAGLWFGLMETRHEVDHTP